MVAPTMTVGQIRAKAAEQAEEVLDAYWRPRLVPVDPIVLARALGISVFKAELGDDVFGMITGSDGGADIYLDRDQPQNRLRFTCAHEIGHFIDRADLIGSGQAFVDRRSDTDRGNAAEVYANEFAGNLLMPERELRAAVRRFNTPYEIAQYFNVSIAALQYRRKLLNL